MDSTQLLKIENGRAEHAFAKASVASENKDFKENYKSYVKKLPMMIKSNGLGSTFAFIFSKKDKKEGKAYKLVADDIISWLKDSKTVDIEQKHLSDLKEFIAYLVALDSMNYRAATSEVLSYLNWLKRFADGMIVDPKGTNGE